MIEEWYNSSHAEMAVESGQVYRFLQPQGSEVEHDTYYPDGSALRKYSLEIDAIRRFVIRYSWSLQGADESMAALELGLAKKRILRPVSYGRNNPENVPDHHPARVGDPS